MTHPKLSRRELLRRMEQGREAMRCLASAAVAAGGTLRVPRDVYNNLARNMKLNLKVEQFTGDILIQVPVAPKVAGTEITFAEIQQRYKHEEKAEGRNDAVRDNAPVQSSPRVEDGNDQGLQPDPSAVRSEGRS